jgi:hypothetical protein
MKQFFLLIVILLNVSCNSEDGWDCIQSTGAIVQKEILLNEFTKIVIEDDFYLEIKQGPEQKIIIETGENLLSDIAVTLEGEVLRFKNNNNCNFNRDFDVTKAYVTTPILNEIRSSSINLVKSNGTLHFPKLMLGSNTNPGVITPGKSGDFILDIEVDELRVIANGQSAFYITGTAQIGKILFTDEIPKFEGANLKVNDLSVFHRSANKVIVNPIEKLSCIIRGTGDIISVNRPPIIEVEEFFSGRLIFQD